MGVDIYGRKTEWKGEKPEINWSEDHTEEAKDEFFKLLHEFEEDNPGYYFRSNWWGWRPIVMLSEIAAANEGLEIDFEYWGSNDGNGLETQEQCNKLADAIEKLMATDGGFVEDFDTLYVNMGSWTNSQGGFVDQATREELNKTLPEGRVAFTGVVHDEGVFYPAHSADKRHIDNFIEFLRDCNGFTIW
jgi:hypothetical protein